MTDPRRQAIADELALLDAEDDFVKAKAKHAAGNLSDAKYREAKDAVRAAREKARSNRTATPATVEASASQEG